MDPDAIGKLKYDKRLLQRRDWVSKEELAQQLESLPDLSDKVDRGDQEGAASTDPGASEG